MLRKAATFEVQLDSLFSHRCFQIEWPRLVRRRPKAQDRTHTEKENPRCLRRVRYKHRDRSVHKCELSCVCHHVGAIPILLCIRRSMRSMSLHVVVVRVVVLCIHSLSTMQGPGSRVNVRSRRLSFRAVVNLYMMLALVQHKDYKGWRRMSAPSNPSSKPPPQPLCCNKVDGQPGLRDQEAHNACLGGVISTQTES